MACKHCKDPETGECLYPYYGVGLQERCQNFEPDPEAQGLGTYVSCPYCGDSTRAQWRRLATLEGK